MENAVEVKIGDNGRFVIPSSIRKRLNLREGDQVRIGVEDGRIIILPPEHLLEEFFGLTRNVRASEEDAVQELIDERRREARER